MILRVLIITTLLTYANYLFSQTVKNDSINNLYSRTINIANELYKNKHYNESIAYYKAAKRLNPNEKLSQFRLEDIKTIFIKHDIAANRDEAQKIIDKVQEKIALKNEKNKVDDFFYDIDTTALAKNNENQKRIDSLVASLNIDANAPNKKNKKETSEVKNTVVTHPVLFTEKPKKANPPKVDKAKKDTIKQKEIIVEQPKKDIKPEENKATVNIEEKPQKKSEPVIIDEEKINRELAQKYPDTKTVENITKKHKKIKKVIINKDGKVTIYLKIIHDWGATYYFVDRSYLKQKNRDITQREFYAQTGEN